MSGINRNGCPEWSGIRNIRISDSLVRLVQVLFALVVAQSLLLYRAVIIQPLGEHVVAAFAMAVIYITVILSWIDWHVTMGAEPVRGTRAAA